MIRLNCLVKLKYESRDFSTYIVNIEPARTSHQSVVSELLTVNGGDLHGRVEYQTPSGTRLTRFTARGLVEITSQFAVDIRHTHGDPAQLYEVAPASLPLSALNYLAPSRYCESDKLMKFAQNEFGWRQPGYQRVLSIAHWVRDHVEFKVGTSQWETSAVDVLERRQGVCRDFAHLTIAMLRALNIPARFVTGIDYGADPDLGPVDFHAYVEALLGDRWYLFDPTGISPTTGLVRIGIGRDAADVSFATIFGSVTSWAPYLEVEAIEDSSQSLELPQRTDSPVSTAEPVAS